jgi:hypothetical protein
LRLFFIFHKGFSQVYSPQMTMVGDDAEIPAMVQKTLPLKGLCQMRRRIISMFTLGCSLLVAASSGHTQEAEVLVNPPRKLPSGPSDCGHPAPAQKIIVEVPPPEIIIQRAHGVCAPEPQGFLQRCNHFRMHQWTKISGHGSAPVSGIPMVFASQSFAPQSFAPQSFVPQSFVPQATVIPQSFVPQSFVPQSFVPQAAVVPQSFVPQSFVPQSFVPQSFVPQSFVPQAFAPQAFCPQGFTPQAGSDDKMDIRTAVKNLSENMETASKLLKAQAQILKIHDEKITSIESTLKDSQHVLDALKGYNIKVEDGKVTATKKN